MQVNVVDARRERAVESDHFFVRSLAQERLRDRVHSIEHVEVLSTQIIAVLNVMLGYYQVMLFRLGPNVWEGDESLVFIDDQSLIRLACLDDLTEFANLRHSPLLIMGTLRIKLVLASRFH